jgi:hypothetical protein
MLLPGGGFFVLAGWVLVFNRLRQRQQSLAKPVRGVA